MKVVTERREQLEALAAEIPCDKRRACLEPDREDLTEVEPVAEGRVLFCLSEEGRSCRRATSFGRTMICMCPVRKAIAENFGK